MRILDTSSLDPERWGMVFALLSLDRTQTLFGAMGLVLRDQKAFFRLSRHAIGEVRAAAVALAASPDNAGALPDVAGHILARVAAELGPDQADVLYGWAVDVFFETHQDHPHWSAYEILFHRAAFEWGMADSLALPEDRLDGTLEAFRDTVDLGDVKAQIEALRADLLSDWDLEIYARRGFADEGTSPPFGVVLSTAEIHRVQRFMAELVKQLSREELDRVVQRGQQTIDSMGIWMPEPLRHPLDLWSPGA